MSELIGDYQCVECGYGTHNPESRVCEKCGGEMVYMMTDAEEAISQIAALTASRDKWQKVAEELGKKYKIAGCECIHCDYFLGHNRKEVHSPDCPITALEKLKAEER